MIGGVGVEGFYIGERLWFELRVGGFAMLRCQGLALHSVFCSTKAGVALSSGRERDDDGKGTRSMRASPTLLLTETDAGRKTAGDCTVSRCRSHWDPHT